MHTYSCCHGHEQYCLCTHVKPVATSLDAYEYANTYPCIMRGILPCHNAYSTAWDFITDALTQVLSIHDPASSHASPLCLFLPFPPPPPPPPISPPISKPGQMTRPKISDANGRISPEATVRSHSDNVHWLLVPAAQAGSIPQGTDREQKRVVPADKTAYDQLHSKSVTSQTVAPADKPASCQNAQDQHKTKPCRESPFVLHLF